MMIWLDDIRTPPTNDWTWCKTVEEVIQYLKISKVTDMSLDHDLGCDSDGKELLNGYDLCKWMMNNNKWPTKSIGIHSRNPVGRANMWAIIEKHWLGINY